MEALYDPKAAKKPTNLSINSELLKVARDMKINLSATLEQALVEAVRQRQVAQWRLQNKEAIQAYNARVEDEGVFSDGLRSF